MAIAGLAAVAGLDVLGQTALNHDVDQMGLPSGTEPTDQIDPNAPYSKLPDVHMSGGDSAEQPSAERYSTT